MKVAIKNNYLALAGNIFLFIIKLVAGLFSGSIALISDAINSFTDILASISLTIATKISSKKADVNHPFGHRRAEPIGALIVAIVAALLGLEIIKESLMFIFNPKTLILNFWVYFVIVVTIVLKGIFYIIFNHNAKKYHAPSIRALAVDSINDVMVTISVLVSFILYNFNIPYVDGIFGMVIGLIVIKNGFSIGLENINYLMGKKPNDEVLKKIKNTVLSIKKVKGINDIFAHYVGPNVHVEVHIEVDKNLKFHTAHDIGKKVQHKIEKLYFVDKAFIHIDPVK